MLEIEDQEVSQSQIAVYLWYREDERKNKNIHSKKLYWDFLPFISVTLKHSEAVSIYISSYIYATCRENVYPAKSPIICAITVDSRFQGTHWNTSRYPYLDISELKEWGKQ